MEAIKAGKQIDKIFVKKDFTGPNAAELLAMAREAGVFVQRVPTEKLNRLTAKNHQGVVAMCASIDYHRLDNLVPQLFEQGDTPLLVVLDELTDVRNFGAIARTCECAAVDAIVIPERNSVSVGADAVKTSAGALLTLPVCREKNLAGAVRFLKQCGVSVIAATEKGSVNYTEADFTGPVAIVMGNEERGISEAVLREATQLVRIPQFGTIQSLNVSVAAGVMIYEAVRQRLDSGMAPADEETIQTI